MMDYDGLCMDYDGLCMDYVCYMYVIDDVCWKFSSSQTKIPRAAAAAPGAPGGAEPTQPGGGCVSASG